MICMDRFPFRCAATRDVGYLLPVATDENVLDIPLLCNVATAEPCHPQTLFPTFPVKVPLDDEVATVL